MRKAINGLSQYVVENFDINPQNGDLFIFYNRKKDRIKILYWHFNGFCCLQKRLEKGQFKIPEKIGDDKITLASHQLKALFEGLHFMTDKSFRFEVFN